MGQAPYDLQASDTGADLRLAVPALSCFVQLSVLPDKGSSVQTIFYPYSVDVYNEHVPDRERSTEEVPAKSQMS